MGRVRRRFRKAIPGHVVDTFREEHLIFPKPFYEGCNIESVQDMYIMNRWKEHFLDVNEPYIIMQQGKEQVMYKRMI